MDKLYKVLGENGASSGGEHETWKLPQDGQPGDWMRPAKGALAETNGHHLCRPEDLVMSLGPLLYEAEARGERLETKKEVIVREARLVRRLEIWNDEVARDFAAACADHVLPIFERQRPEDDRPRRAIEAARLFTLGIETADELGAAWRAARDVMTADLLTVSGGALAAARAAAMSAAVGAGWSPLSAAGHAARSGREAAAWDATHQLARDHWGATDLTARTTLHDSMATTWAAAEARERAWQTERLLTCLGIGQVPVMDIPVVAEQVAEPLVHAAAL